MPPPNFAFGGGVSGTTINPLAAGLLALAAVLILVLPRKYVIAPVMLAIFLVPMGNVLVVAGLHIMPMRLIVLVGWARILWTKFSTQEEILAGGWNGIDTVFLCWALFRAVDFVLLWRDLSALINQFGFLWTALGGYFLFRFLIRDDEDIVRTVKAFVVIALVCGPEMVFEHHTDHNLFGSILGGVSPVSAIRNGTIRAQGPFGHSILAGVFGAVLIPLLFWMWKSGKAKTVVIVGVVTAILMMSTTGSSTPLLACGAAVGALCLWPLRGKMRVIRWGIVCSLVGLQLVMKAPVWFLLNHVNVIGGSGGYDRAMLIDTFVRHFGSWWLLGIRSTASWGWDMWDLSNQFVAEGVVGGLASLIFFIFMIKRAFGALGTARKAVEGDRQQEWLLWALGATLFTYVAAFFGVSLWDQTQIAWYALFAMVCAASFPRIARQKTEDATPPAESVQVMSKVLEPELVRSGVSR